MTMKTIFTLIFASLLTLAATAPAQTIKSLGYNTTNGEVVANTGTNVLTFTNAVGFTTNAAAATRTNLGLGATNDVEFGTIKWGDQQYQDYGLMVDGFGLYTYTTDVSTNLVVALGGVIDVQYPISFNNTTNAAITRTNLGLGATNTAFSILQSASQTNHFINLDNAEFSGAWSFFDELLFDGESAAAATRTNLGVAPAPIFKVLTNDFSITNQTNMTVVDGLTIATEAGKAYIFELFSILSASALATSFQIVASNATVYGNWDGFATGSFGIIELTSVFNFSVTNTRVPVQKFYVIAGTNAGGISFQFSSTTETNVNTIGAGSYMKAQEVVPTP